MKTGTVCVIGGGGFVGHHLTAQLSNAGWCVRIPSRHPERQRDLCVLPGVQVMHANDYDTETLRTLCRDCDAVINLVGILNEKGHDGRGFQRAHVELTQNIIAVCRELAVPRLLHMSALNADAREAHSHYLRTKGIAEDLVHASSTQDLRVTSFQPSVIFGPGDGFFNRFGALLKIIPVAFPLACPDALFAPVYVGDVAAAFVTALTTPDTAGQRYALCGPTRYTLRQLVEYTARTLGLRRRIIGLSPALSSLQSRVFEYLPGKPFSRDNYWSLQRPSICNAPFPDMVGIVPSSIEAIVPGYLANRTQRSRYDDIRKWQ